MASFCAMCRCESESVCRCACHKWRGSDVKIDE